jgi:chitodextrinase
MTPVRRYLCGLATTLLTLLALGSLPPGALGQANVKGQWQTLPNVMPINPIHVALMRNGKVLIVSGSGNVANNSNFQAGLFDPQTGTVTTQAISWDMFCNGMVVLPDGRVFVNGGTLQYDPFHGELRSSIYDPATGTFTDVQNMAHGRWYPTVTVLGDGTVMTFSGLTETGGTNTAVEIYTVGSGWSQQYGAGWTPPLYPRMHLLPDGTVFYSGSGTGSRKFNPGTKTWTGVIATTNYSGTRTYGTSVLLPLTPASNYRPRVMIFGGGSPATATTEIIDLSAPTPAWQFGPPMSQARIEMSATILPNGKVLAMGGSVNDEDTSTASLNADLYDPVANTFSSAGQNAYARLYHSVALLLPDATVWFAGGNPARGSYEQHMEIYSPPYLFNASGGPATRPTITSVPAAVGYGAAFQIQTPDAASISSIALVRPGSPTHAFDQEQRLVNLTFTTGSGVLNATAPPNGNIAPPGYYMLFILNSSGVPSVAKFVQLSSNPTNQPPTATITSPASNVTITAGQAVSFSGSGSDPDGTISAYSWTFPGGSPSTSTLANPGNVIYSTAGTYVASLTVTDNGGLTSQPATRTVTVQSGSGSASIQYVQGNYAVPQSPQTTVSVTYPGAQTAGNFNIVVVGWSNSTSSVTSVTDSSNNIYNLAVGPTVQSGVQSQSIYYAKSIAAAGAGANTVTVRFSASTPWPDIRILEYSGIDGVNPVDVTAAGFGSGSLASTPAVNTMNANDLLFAADIVTTVTEGPGAGFTRRILTSPNGDIAEDRVVSSTGSYSGTAPISSGQWVMQMVAFRAASLGPPDTTAPTAPSNLAATGVSSSQINLSWTASTDNVGVANYLLERCQGAGCSNFAQIATPTGTTYSDTGLSVLTSYSYRVRARDAANNLSGYSNTASATPPDTTPPTAPSNLTATASSTSQINLSWTASTDNVAVTGYWVERCQGAGCTNFAQLPASPTGTTFSDTGLSASTTYVYRVRATDAASNLSVYSNTASATTQAVPDTTPPTAPSNLTAAAASSSQINLSWTASTDNVGVANYRVERCQGAGCTNFAQLPTTPTGTTYNDTGLSPSTTYLYRVRAADAAGNLSAYSNAASATTQAAPPPPSTPIYIQNAYAVPQSPQSSVSVTFPLAQTAGNFNILVVGWNDSTARVNTISDTRGNAYILAVGPVVQTGYASQAIYYAKNIAAGTNTITVTFTAAAVYPDIRALEYAGIDTVTPVDVAASNQGNSVTSSATVTTVNARDLLFAANVVQSTTERAGTGFTSRVITYPDGDIAEDQFVITAGTYTASATLSVGARWIMQVVAFRAAGSP